MRAAVLAILFAILLSLGGPGSRAYAIVGGVETGDSLRNVGMLVGRANSDSPWLWLQCSGTLIARDVFLTAGHCIAPSLPLGVHFGVTFVDKITIDQTAPFGTPIPAGVPVYPGTGIAHPDFNIAFLTVPDVDSFDLAVVVLDAPVKGIPPAHIVEADHFPRMEKAYAGPLKIGLAGYGTTSFSPFLGTAPFDWGTRRYTTGSLSQIFPAKVTVAPGPGQICAGDSGGPGLFVGARGLNTPLPNHASVITSTVSFTVLTSTAPPCATASIMYRLDTPQARRFLTRFVPGL